MRSIPPLNALRAFESAVSHQVKHLETFLKMTIFDRSARAVMLTAAGSTYLPFLQKAFDSISDGTRLLTRAAPEDILTIRKYSIVSNRVKQHDQA